MLAWTTGDGKRILDEEITVMEEFNETSRFEGPNLCGGYTETIKRGLKPAVPDFLPQEDMFVEPDIKIFVSSLMRTE